MITQITRRLEFDAGHRLVGHESKCSRLHGHRYVAEITCQAERLDAIGRVIDFSKIKEVVGGWIDANWDHSMILTMEDPLVACGIEVFGTQYPYVMTVNPTAENMVEVLAQQAAVLLAPFNIQVVTVRLYETPNCFADYNGN